MDEKTPSLKYFVTALLIAVTVWYAYRGVIGAPFFYDDMRHITDNPNIRSLSELKKVFAGTTRPLAMLSFAVNYYFSGIDPAPYRIVNIALHAVNAFVLYLIALLLLRSPKLRDRFAGHGYSIATAGALLWAVHPALTSPVSYIVQRMLVMGVTFALFALLFYIQYSIYRKGCFFAVGSFFCSVMAVFCKESLIAMPFVFMLVDYVFSGGEFADDGKRGPVGYLKFNVFTIVICAVIITGLFSINGTSHPNMPYLAKINGGQSIGGFLIASCGSVLHYVRILVLDDVQCFDHGQAIYPSISSALSATGWLLPLILLTAVAITGYGIYKRRVWAFPVALYLVLLAPTTSIWPSYDVVVEYRQYLASAGLLFGLVSFFALIFFNAFPVTSHTETKSICYRVVCGVMVFTAIAVIFFLANKTDERNRVYLDHLSLWEDTAKKAPRNIRAQRNVAACLVEKGRLDQAMVKTRANVEAFPQDAESRADLAWLLLRMGKYSEAEPENGVALRLEPDNPRALINGALIARNKHDYQLAEHLLLRAEKISVSKATVAVHLANLYLDIKELGKTRTYAQKALFLQPRNVDALGAIGMVCIAEKDYGAAVGYMQKALAIKPAGYLQLFNLGYALHMKNDTVAAEKFYRKSLHANEKYYLTHYNLGCIYFFLKKDYEGAADFFCEAIRLNPEYKPARIALNECHKKMGLGGMMYTE